MEHVVFYPTVDGAPAFRRIASLEEAVRLVEHLRNVEGVSEVSCHALTEVPLAFKAYYRVEVPTSEAAAVEAPVLEAPAVEAPVLVEADVLPQPDVPAIVEVPEQPVPETAPTASLGFFSR